MHLIVHDSTHLCLLLISLAIAVELGILKLCSTKLGQDLLPEISARFVTDWVAQLLILNFNAWPDIRGAQVLVILAHHILDVALHTMIADLVTKLIDLSVYIVLKCI